MMARLSIQLLGAFRVQRDGKPVTGFQTNKTRALLAYLAAEAQWPHQRAHLAGLLWPEWPEDQARTYLRQALATLQRILDGSGAPTPFLLTTRDTIQFNPASDIWLDVAVLSEAFANLPRLAASISSQEHVTPIAEAVARYSGNFLEGFFLDGCSAFEEWQLLTRERLQRQVVEALGLLLQWYERAGDLAQATRYAWQRVELEPLSEEGHQQLLRLLARRGESNAALAHYARYCRLLQEELEAAPSPATAALVAQIRAGAWPAALDSAGQNEQELPIRDASAFPRLASAAKPRLPPLLATLPAPPREAPLFVDRTEELTQLEAHLAAALTGQGRALFVVGDAGEGKSALIREFVQRAHEAHPTLLVAGGHCSSHRGVGDPFLPFREILAQLTCDFTIHQATSWLSRDQAQRLYQALPHTLDTLLTHAPDLLDTLLPRPALAERITLLLGDQPWSQRLVHPNGRVAPTVGPADLQRRALFAHFTKLIQGVAAHQPLLLWLEDLQWIDLNSAALLFHCGAQLVNSPILLVGSYRPEEVALPREGRRHPLERVLHELQHLYGDISIDLSRADGRQFIDAYLDSEPNRFDRAFREILYRISRGHPLFTVELVRSLQERGDLVADAKGYWAPAATLNWQRLPARVEAVIAERIQRLPPNLHTLLAVASVQGERFTAEVVAAVLGADRQATVQQLSQELVRQHRLVAVEGVRRLGEQRLAGYRFRHILFQQYLYATLDDIERAQLHEAVAQALETLHQLQPDALSAIAGELAWHYRQADILDKAARYYYRSGNHAIQLAAMDEAEAHFQEGLTLLARTPASTAHSRLELDIRMGLVTVQTITQGHGTAAAEQSLTQAQQLCRRVGDEPILFRVLWHLWQLHFQRGNMRKAQAIATEALAIAQRLQEPTSVLLAHEMLGPTLYRLGEMVAAYAHLLEARRLYEAQPGHGAFLFGLDAGLHGRLNEALMLWYLGYYDQAQARSAEAPAIAEQSEHPYHLASAMIFTAALYQRAAAAEETAKFANKAIQLSAEHYFALWHSVGFLYHGWAVAAQGDLSFGLAETQQGSDAILATGMKHIRYLAVLADVYRMAGQSEKALALVDDLLTTVEATAEREWEAELHRLKGVLLLQQGWDDQAEDCYRRAIAIAHQQQSKFLELRATVSLCRLWQAQGKTQEAWQLLTTLYHWFTAGFDAPDLRTAKELLEELQTGQS